MAKLRQVWDEGACLSTLVNFEDCDTPNEAALDKNTENYPLDDNSKSENCQQIRFEAVDFPHSSTDPAARVATLKRRNQQLQKALAVSSVHHAREVAAMRREINKLRQQLAELLDAQEGLNKSE